MTGLDTNVLVRYFTQDNAAQYRRAARLIEKELSPQAPGVVSCLVLVELFWVLRRLFKLPAQALGEVMETLLGAPQLAIEDRGLVRQALALAASGADFADALIALHQRKLGCVVTVTFDRRAATIDGMKLLA